MIGFNQSVFQTIMQITFYRFFDFIVFFAVHQNQTFNNNSTYIFSCYIITYTGNDRLGHANTKTIGGAHLLPATGVLSLRYECIIFTIWRFVRSWYLYSSTCTYVYTYSYIYVYMYIHVCYVQLQVVRNYHLSFYSVYLSVYKTIDYNIYINIYTTYM